MNSTELAEALKLLDSLYEQSQSFREWLAGSTIQQDSYEEARRQIEAANPGLRVIRVSLAYRIGHVLAPID